MKRAFDVAFGIVFFAANCAVVVEGAQQTSEQQAAVRPIAQFVLFDGESGASRDYWNRGVLIAWKNPCGDWRDAEDRPQGPKPFATVELSASSAPQVVPLEATELARFWLERGNSGALLRAATGYCELAARENTDAQLRPRLEIATDQGEFVCPCTADTSMNRSTYRPQGVGPTCQLGAGSANVAMQFDLSAVRGKLKKATIVLHATAQRGKCVIELMRLDAPAIHTGGPAKLGLAKDYPYDKDIAKHPDVVFATDFSGSEWRKLYFTEGSVSEPQFAEDPLLRSTYLRGKLLKGQTGSCSLDYRWTTHGQPEPEEIYFRYYVMFEDDFGSLIDGNKMPGLAGRYGLWNGRYWEPACGNGGSRTTGLASMGSRGKTLCGWSLRGLAHKKPADDNPYRHYVAVGTYAYHVDQEGHFGDHWRWGTVLLERGRWYCIEQYAKMNTVSGPFDQLGNGTGQRDGVFRVWLDGVQVFEKTDIRFRHNPAIKIDEVWLNWYHGGTQPAAADHHYRMSNIVVARSYIGPMSRPQ